MFLGISCMQDAALSCVEDAEPDADEREQMKLSQRKPEADERADAALFRKESLKQTREQMQLSFAKRA